MKVTGGSPADARVRLETWGEIASHLGVEVRTAQRWERKLQLPVRRLQGSQAVYAYADELDAWRTSRESATTTVAEDAPSAPTISSRKWVVTALASVAAVAVVLLTVVAMRRSPVLEPVDLAIQGKSVIALDATGAIAWSYDFGETAIALPMGHRSAFGRWWQRVDVDADGTDEILFIVGHSRGESMPRERLYVLTLQGKLRFSYEPHLSLKFAARTFSTPWIFMDVEAVAAEKTLWLSLANSPWWPGAVVSLDAAGHDTLRYTQPGVVQVLSAFKDGQQTRIVAAGVNNEFASASMAMLDPSSEPSRAPSSEQPGQFDCLDCPRGSPLRYVLLPRSPLNIAAGVPYNRVDSIVTSDTLDVMTYEAGQTSGIVYQMTKGLDIVRAMPTDSYWTWAPANVDTAKWQALQTASAPPIVRRWSARGWDQTEIKLPHNRNATY